MITKTLLKLAKQLASKLPAEEQTEYLMELEDIKEEAKKEAIEELDKIFE